MSVGAIEPVGITKASASNVRNRNASTNATTIDSTVSRMACELVAGWVGTDFADAFVAVCVAAFVEGSGFFVFCLDIGGGTSGGGLLGLVSIRSRSTKVIRWRAGNTGQLKAGLAGN